MNAVKVCKEMTLYFILSMLNYFTSFECMNNLKLGWLEPLLFHIMENRKTITVPTIDLIDDENMEITPCRKNIRGGFDLGLSFTWDNMLPEHLAELKNDRTAPIRMPTMPGGLFAMDREYFYKLGSYDEKMTYWGGENLEL